MKIEVTFKDSEGYVLKKMAKDLGINAETYVLAITNYFARNLALAMINMHPHGISQEQMIRDIKHELNLIEKNK